MSNLIIYRYLQPNPDKPEMKIENLWYRFALSFLSKSAQSIFLENLQVFISIRRGSARIVVIVGRTG